MITNAAIKLDCGIIIIAPRPMRHDDLIHELAKRGFQTPINREYGFMASDGVFLDRVTAKRHALYCEQIIKTEFPQLYTEDLW